MANHDSLHDDKFLQAELDALQAMAESLEDYLLSDQLLWPLTGSGGMLPRLTVGGLLMRQHRMAYLQDVLAVDQRLACHDALQSIDMTLNQWAVHAREKMLQEWTMRVNLLAQFIRDCDDLEIVTDCVANWRSHAEQRVMLHHLQDALSRYDGASDRDAELARIDRSLRRIVAEGESGHFLWADELVPIYPPDVFWWLWVAPPDDPID